MGGNCDRALGGAYGVLRPLSHPFFIEGKSYALLVLFVALALWWQNQGTFVPYATSVA
jgi:hypothetical protein